MPQGYLVTLGNSQLDPGDTISGGEVIFTTDRSLGTGDWIWSGTFGGTTYTNEVEPGEYFLATNGNVYFVPDFGPVDTISSASVDAYTSDGVVTGSTGDETISSGYTEVDGDEVQTGAGGINDEIDTRGGNDSVSSGSGADTVYGGAGNDTISGGDGADELWGQADNDSIDGGTGADTIYGNDGDDTIDGGIGNDLIFGGDGQDVITGGDGADTIYGDSDSSGPPAPTVITTSNYTDTSSGYALTAQNVVGGALSSASLANVSASGGFLGASGAVSDTDSGDNNQIAFDLASGLSENLTVTLDNETDALSFDVFSLQTQNFAEVGHWAVYNGGTLVAESDFTEVTPGTGGGTITISGVGNFDRVVFTALAQTDGTDGSDYSVGNITFTPISTIDGDDDSIDGGDGADLIYGEVGNDTLAGGAGADTLDGGDDDDLIYVSEADQAAGGLGDDTFIVQDLGEAGANNATIDGGTEGATDNDVLDLRQVTLTDLTITSVDPTTGETSGTATLADGSVVSFSNIETVITCFAQSTEIATPNGAVPIQNLRAGDLVLTRDHGPQSVRWICCSLVPAVGRGCPVIMAPGSWGNRRQLSVSPDHRILLAGPRVELMYGTPEVLVAAKYLVGLPGITQRAGGMVTYYHLLLDRHEILFAQDVLCESFYPGPQSMARLSDTNISALQRAMERGGQRLSAFGPTARRCLSRQEAKAYFGHTANPRISRKKTLA